eukprot:TRINITY_DN1346_c0_g1_i4.p2 TRINITY_DN1346_c0_g1~~TRINITY_DN1346_c0_g1_i4.p2  ORF type:complete len:147 (-),score=41.49 TRINITY_DN1346_c0_g1_i4:59-499(-)
MCPHGASTTSRARSKHTTHMVSAGVTCSCSCWFCSPCCCAPCCPVGWPIWLGAADWPVWSGGSSGINAEYGGQQGAQQQGEQNQQEQEQVTPADTMCVVCFERAREVVLAPCGHMGLCQPCSELLHECPVCRAPYSPDQAIKVFKP